MPLSFPNNPAVNDTYTVDGKTWKWNGTGWALVPANTDQPVQSVAGKTGTVVLAKGDVGLGNVDNTSDANKPVSTAAQAALDSKAPLASPTLTGTPTAPTAAVDTNTTQLATTAFVVDQASATSPLMNGTAASGSSLRYSRQDHVHPSDTAKADLASPALTGTPTAPTAAAGTNTTQIATTAFVTTATDAARQGLSVKQACRAATTANITLSAPQTIDGVSVVAGDRVLVKDQSTGSQNGIYVVAAGAWTRATDFDADADITDGAFTFVEEGTANADSGWVLTTNGPITVGTTALSFAQFSGAGQITAGDGLTKTGNTLNVVGTAGRISVAADSVDLASGVIGTTGTYKSVTVDTYGRVTGGTNPTTLSGYGITDAVSKTLTSGNILVGNASNVATGVAVTGDVTITNAGVTAIGSGVIVNADVNASAAIAGTKISPDFGTQTVKVGTGGEVLIGYGTQRTNISNSVQSASLQLEGLNEDRRLLIVSDEASGVGPSLVLAHQRSGTVGGNTVLLSGDQYGALLFQGSDGTNFINGATIQVIADGAPSNGVMPSRMAFYTNPGGTTVTERLTIDKDGRIGIGFADPTANLHVRGAATAPPLKIAAGALLTTPEADAFEYDGINLFHTSNNTTNGPKQALIPEIQFSRLTSDNVISDTTSPGTTIFGSTVRPALLAGEVYEVEMQLVGTKTTSGTITVQASLSTGNFTFCTMVAIPTPTAVVIGGTTSPVTIFTSASLANAINYQLRITGLIQPAANSRLDMLLVNGAGSFTVAAGSYIKVTCLGNAPTIGNFG